ncbi:MAG: VanZ family protein [Clostridiales Family XIII bacterium]|jgi:VanZ family protein|nr:VanZ family protein [Clostridiales Family XIII bacterium]
MKKTKRRVVRGTVVSVGLTAFIMGFIYFMSSMPGEDSSQMSNFIVRNLERLIPAFDYISGAAYQGAHELLSWMVRKGAHFTEYALLGFFLAAAFHTYLLPEDRTAGRLFRGFFFALLIGVAYAGTDEFHQSFVSGRAAMLMDVGFDGAGVFVGALLSTLFIGRTKIRYINPKE